MSLKARLEAVIYAAEEPVTLQQLATLFAEDAYAWKAEREAAMAAETEPVSAGDTPAAAEPADSGHELGTELTDLLLPPAPEPAIASEASEPHSENSSESTEDPALEARRAERKREREVREILREVLDELIADCAQDSRGIEIREIAGGFRMGTKPEMHDSVRAFVKSLKPPLKLSLPALETLAVIAYKQPVTAPEVGEIRGVDSAGVLGSLMSRKLIATAGRKQVIGRPMLYKTTKEFLVRFGLKDVSELPSMEEFEKMAAIEMSEDGTEEEVAPAFPMEQSGDLFHESGRNPASTPDAAVVDSSQVETGTEAEAVATDVPGESATEPVADLSHLGETAPESTESTDETESAHPSESESLPEPAQVEVES
jgi:segregation and condensation protein B